MADERVEFFTSRLPEILARDRGLAARLVDATDALCAGLDASGRILFVNRSIERTTGRERSLLTGRDWFKEITPLHEKSDLFRAFTSIIKEGKAAASSTAAITGADGHPHAVDWTMAAARDGTRIVGAILFGMPVDILDPATPTAVERGLVPAITTGALGALRTTLDLSGDERRSVGLSAGLALPSGTAVRDGLAAYSSLGIGTLTIADLDNDRASIQGSGMAEATGKSSHTQCAFALGFLEGAFSASEDGHWLGSELKCMARGDERCLFALRKR